MASLHNIDSALPTLESEDSSLRSFIHADTLLPRLDHFCRLPSENELNYLQATLDQYQDASYLLEPHLQRLTEGPLDAFKLAFASKQDAQEDRIAHLARYIYWLSKVVSPKLIVRYFPHAPSDLTLLLSSISAPSFSNLTWETRYILLLWLSLVISIPFSLTKFGENVPAQLEAIIRQWLSSPGKEREAIATVASKYYGRKDVTDDQLADFLRWSSEQLQTEDADVFTATGILQFLSTFVKSATRQSFSASVLSKLYNVCALFDPANAGTGIPNSPLLRRLRAKYQGRLAGAYLPPPQAGERRRTKSRATVSGSNVQMEEMNEGDFDFNVPEQVEALIADLLEMLSDPDSRVRWTTSKALARISSQLPLAYIDQLVSAILETYTENVIHHNTASEDLSLVSSSTWHGAMLCLSSFLRSTILSPDQVQDCLPWILRGLTFAQRKGAHKIGSSIRDASCYFVWCAARASSKQADLLREKDVHDLARKLVVVACTDEEVSVRRAASAAFQECVGRLTNVPDGLDVLVLMDAFIVGSRRSAFLEAAPSISKCSTYGTALEAHLLVKSLPHADIQIRQLAATSLCKILARDPNRTAEVARQQITSIATVKQSGVAHGSLLFLTEVAATTSSQHLKQEIFVALGTLPQPLLSGSSIVLLLPTIAQVTTASLAWSSFDISAIDQKATWRRYVEIAQKRPEPASHQAAADIIAAVSSRIDCLADLKATLRTLKITTSFLTQQCVTLMLGAFDFKPRSTCNELLDIVIDRLSKVLDTKNTPSYKSIEAKRNALDSLVKISVSNLDDPKNTTGTALAALSACREDYTTDERGDVGSWVRMVCIKRSTDMILAMHDSGGQQTTSLHETIAFLLKQSAERLDNVREVAGEQLGRISPILPSLQEANLSLQDWRQLSVALPQILRLLPSSTHQDELVSGIVVSVGGPPESIQPGTTIFLDWARTLPVYYGTFSLVALLNLLADIIKRPGQSNRVIIPTLQTLASIMQEENLFDSFQKVIASQSALRQVEVLATDSALKSKVQARILAGARILMLLSTVPSLRAECLGSLASLRDGARTVLRDLLADYAIRSPPEVRSLFPSSTKHAEDDATGANEQ